MAQQGAIVATHDGKASHVAHFGDARPPEPAAGRSAVERARAGSAVLELHTLRVGPGPRVLSINRQARPHCPPGATRTVRPIIGRGAGT